MNIKNDTRNELLKRNELKIVLVTDKTPSFASVKEMISKDYKKPVENIDVLKISGNFGRKEFDITADVYDDKKDLENFVNMRKTKKARDQEKKKVLEAEQKAREEVESAKTPPEKADEAEVAEKTEEIVESEKEKVEDGKETVKEAEKEIAEDIEKAIEKQDKEKKEEEKPVEKKDDKKE